MQVNLQKFINAHQEKQSNILEVLNGTREIHQIININSIPFVTQSKVESMLKTENNIGMIFCLLTKQRKIEINCFSNRNELTAIVIPPSIKSIENNAFYGCANLKQVIIPQSVTFIGANAFYNCKCLTKIIIPSSVTLI